ncbi:PBP1A family penicillin-binding protein [Candidatus Saccharibacteria bacterium]|nr:PBP1A family penicillin-binding protein [Candidatus Saccharibacteria bacterium]
MYRQGKYTRRPAPHTRVQQFLSRRYDWWKQLKWWKKIAIISAPFVTFLILTPILTYIYYYNDISSIDVLLNKNNTGVVLMDKNGKTFFSIDNAAHREPMKLAQISDNAENALVASEDKDFYKHGGFSLLSIVRSLYTNIISRSIAGGGSTITQQLAKNLLLTKNQTIMRKYQELIVATAIEQRYSKNQILAMYLNSVYYGENAFGIEAAAKTYFNKNPSQLTLAESAMLIGLLPAPSAYSPISGDPELAKERQTTVLTRMVRNGYIQESEKQAALKEKLVYKKQVANKNNPAPHFTEMILSQLYKKYGEEKVKRSGFQVKTTLDLAMQKNGNRSIDDGMAHIRMNGGSNASLVAIDPKTGGIRALVGSYDYTDRKFGNVNMVTTPRQPGSSFKPIYYSKALANGMVTPATLINDQKITDLGGYSPQNASLTYHGKVTVRQALDWSLNIPAVRVMQKLGVDESVKVAKNLGISTLDSSKNYGLALALGVAEVPLVQMTNAYAAFANAGEQHAYYSIQSIEDKYGHSIFTASQDSHRAISEQGAYLISNILSDNTTRSKVFGTSLTVVGSDGQMKTVAVKTGTTENAHDAWTVGYTPDIAVGVWVGNNDNTQMYSGGSDMAGPIWRQMMSAVIGSSSPRFTQPSGIVKASVCTDIGVLSDVFLSDNVPKQCSKPPVKKPTKKDDTKNNASEKCTIPGKESLAATDPDCVVDMCSYPGLEAIASNDPNCVDPTTTDTDSDGVMNNIDQCPGTDAGAEVDAVGCAANQTANGTSGGPNDG